MELNPSGRPFQTPNGAREGDRIEFRILDATVLLLGRPCSAEPAGVVVSSVAN